MSGLMAGLKARGAVAARRGGLIAAAVLVSLIALVFLAVALAVALAMIVPLYLALVLSAVVLLVLGGVFAAFASDKKRRTALQALPDRPLFSRQDLDEWRKGLQHHSLNWLSGAATANPRKAILAALVAGGAIIAIEALGRRIR